MRGAKEIFFRLKQEAANVLLLAAQPSTSAAPSAPLGGLPDPSPVIESLQGTKFAAELERLAGEILQHRFPLLGISVDTGPEIGWRRDYIHNISGGTPYFRTIPYLDFERAGDHKNIWELNRHQHLVVLAQAFRFTRRREFLEELFRQLESWWTANPFQRGINWTSALEVAFRALSWIWVYHLAGDQMGPAFRRRFLTALYRHGLHLQYNLSIYFSPNTHLLGEAVALHALGVLFPEFPRAQQWEETGGRIVREQMDFQVREDGSHFEQSTYYHVYALDFFLLYFALTDGKVPGSWREKLHKMVEYLDALLGPDRVLSFLGDDDGGRLFHPYGGHARYGRATLATAAVLLDRGDWLVAHEDLYEQAAWWCGGRALGQSPRPRRAAGTSRLFPNAGIAVLESGETQVIVDAGPFGHGGAGHSHSDTLSLVVRSGGREVLIDPGTYTYIASAKWRNWFRGSAAHNTIRVDGLDQATGVGPFRWSSKPEVKVLQTTFTPERDFMDAVCRYSGFTHRRRILFCKPDLIFILDEVDGPAGVHLVEQFWHPGEPVIALGRHAFQIGCSALVFSSWGAAEIQEGWRSPALGKKMDSPVICISRNSELPAYLGTVLDLSGKSGPSSAVQILEENGVVSLELEGPRRARARLAS